MKREGGAEPESLLLRGYQGLIERAQTMDAAERSFIPLAAGWIADYYASSGHMDKAAEWREKTSSSK
jgi:hypothetical protein